VFVNFGFDQSLKAEKMTNIKAAMSNQGLMPNA
jgi:hypothetical protein